MLGFDCGTYESKGTLCDAEGKVLATACAKHLLKVPKPGYAEHDPIGDWWMDFKSVVKELLTSSGIKAEEIAGICISTIMAAITAVDEKGGPLRNAILYGIDTRCQAQAQELNERIGNDRMTQISGATCNVEAFGPKMLWIRENEPEVYEKTRHFTIAAGFLNARLTGRYCVDRYSAMRAQPMLDVRTMTWSDELTPFVCDKAMLPDIVWATDIIGTVTKEAADETGLSAGTPVMGGTTDGGAEAVSVGVVEPGDTMIMYGSTLFLAHLTTALRPDAGLWTGLYLLKDRYCITSGMATAGSLTRWVRDQFARDLVQKEEEGQESAYAALFREAEGIPAGADGLIVLPYFMGERMPIQDPQAKGVIFGLNLTHTRGHVVKAVFEGIGYGLDQNLDCLRRIGSPLHSITAVGGGTKSPIWLQTISDVCGIRQTVPEITIGASYGDALLAGLGTGLIPTPAAIKGMIRTRYTTEPDMEKHAQYARLKKHYADLYRRNKDIMHDL